MRQVGWKEECPKRGEDKGRKRVAKSSTYSDPMEIPMHEVP